MAISPIRDLVGAIGLAICLFHYGNVEMALADGHGKVRMYKLNKKGQLSLQRWVKKPEVEGCKSSYKERKVQRFAQTGFAYCNLFSEKNCLSGSEVTAIWGGKKYRSAGFDVSEPQTRLLPGTKWHLAEGENVTVQSWYCEY